MTVLEVLQAARKLIAKRSHWCKDMSAADSEGVAALYWSETACQWCAWAAILRVGGPSVNDKAIALLERHTDGMSLIRFNDKSDPMRMCCVSSTGRLEKHPGCVF